MSLFCYCFLEEKFIGQLDFWQFHVEFLEDVFTFLWYLVGIFIYSSEIQAGKYFEFVIYCFEA